MGRLISLLTPFTTPTTFGVAFRYGVVIVTTLLAATGLLDAGQTAGLRSVLLDPELVGALAAVLGAVVTGYAVVTKSRSVKADAAGKQIDKDVPKDDPVRVITPPGSSDFVVTESGGVLKSPPS